MKRFFSTLLFGLFAVSAYAQEAPDAMIKKVTEEVLTIVRQDKDIQSGNTRKAIELVETKVLPYFDFQSMTRLALGRDWNNATPEQQKRLTQEFRTLLVRTYSNALTEYRDQTVRYLPFRAQGKGTEDVRTEIVQPGRRPVALVYTLEKQADGWKVIDVSVAGASLVTNYRNTFTQKVRADGIDGLVQMIAEQNKQLEAGKK